MKIGGYRLFNMPILLFCAMIGLVGIWNHGNAGVSGDRES